jgi:hypothetical protein
MRYAYREHRDQQQPADLIEQPIEEETPDYLSRLKPLPAEDEEPEPDLRAIGLFFLALAIQLIRSWIEYTFDGDGEAFARNMTVFLTSVVFAYTVSKYVFRAALRCNQLGNAVFCILLPLTMVVLDYRARNDQAATASATQPAVQQSEETSVEPHVAHELEPTQSQPASLPSSWQQTEQR